MSFTVYIIYSAAVDRLYVGQTSNLQDRLYRHNHSGSKSTKKANDWRVVYTEVFETRTEAIARENAIKRKKSREYMQKLIGER
ncbi:MAG: GIY-YIG nuclease family protein [Hydrotalea sp.]|nr:GIY-YIG nuclease family protein [Hydrotalea sp.]